MGEHDTGRPFEHSHVAPLRFIPVQQCRQRGCRNSSEILSNGVTSTPASLLSTHCAWQSSMSALLQCILHCKLEFSERRRVVWFPLYILLSARGRARCSRKLSERWEGRGERAPHARLTVMLVGLMLSLPAGGALPVHNTETPYFSFQHNT